MKSWDILDGRNPPAQTADSWPDKYGDLRDRPHPDVLRLTVKMCEEMREDTLNAVEAISEGKEQPTVVSFRTAGHLQKILAERRIELPRVLMATEDTAESISALADDLDRDYRTVHDDVSLLAEYGLLFIVEDGQSKRPFLPYERIHPDVELVGGPSSENTLRHQKDRDRECIGQTLWMRWFHHLTHDGESSDDSERLHDSPVWARLFTQVVGCNAAPTWAGPLGESLGDGEYRPRCRAGTSVSE